MAYQKYYPNGWKSGEVGATPITPEALNNMENGIAAAVRTDDIVDNLTSTATNKPLSAKQGKALKELVAQSTAITAVSTGISNINGYRMGNCVQLKAQNVAISASAAGWQTVGTLPTELRPYVEVYFPVYDNGASSYASSPCLTCRIKTNGEVAIYVYSDKLSIRGVFTAVYFAA